MRSTVVFIAISLIYANAASTSSLSKSRSGSFDCPSSCTSCNYGGLPHYDSHGKSQEFSGALDSHQCIWFEKPDHSSWFDVSLTSDYVQSCPLCAAFNIYPDDSSESYYCESGSVFSVSCKSNNDQYFTIECANDWSGCHYGFQFFNTSSNMKRGKNKVPLEQKDLLQLNCVTHQCYSPISNNVVAKTAASQVDVKEEYVSTRLPSCNGCYFSIDNTDYACCKNISYVENRCFCNKGPCIHCAPQVGDKKKIVPL